MGRDQRDDDDGRTVADMSGVSGPGLFGGLFGRRLKDVRSSGRKKPSPDAGDQERPDIFVSESAQTEKSPSALDQPMTPEERRMYMLGAIKAAVLIGLVYIVGIGGFVLLLLFVWDIL